MGLGQTCAKGRYPRHWMGVCVAAALLSTSSLAQVKDERAAMGREQYRDELSKLDARAAQVLARCTDKAGSARALCRMQAQGQQKIDHSALEARYHPSGNNNFKAQAAKVELAYDTAMVHCKAEAAGVRKDDKKAQAAAQECRDQAKAQRNLGIKEAQELAARNASLATPPKSAVERARDAAIETAARKCDSQLGEANLQCVKALPPEARALAKQPETVIPKDVE